jgi:hypothetical protein
MFLEMILIESIFIKYNFKKRLLPIVIDWEEIEQIIAFRLPEDYKYFLENYHESEGFVGPQYLRLWDYNNLLENNNGYGITDNLPYTLGIGSNGGGEFLAIEQKDPDGCRIVLSPFIDLSQEYHIEIGASFSDMFIRLDNGQEWFN